MTTTPGSTSPATCGTLSRGAGAVLLCGAGADWVGLFVADVLAAGGRKLGRPVVSGPL